MCFHGTAEKDLVKVFCQHILGAMHLMLPSVPENLVVRMIILSHCTQHKVEDYNF